MQRDEKVEEQLEDCGKEREEVELNREKIRGLETAVRVRE